MNQEVDQGEPDLSERLNAANEEIERLKNSEAELRYRAVCAENLVKEINRLSNFHIVGIHGRTNKEKFRKEDS